MKMYDVITIFPEMFKSLTDFGITSRAFQKRLCDFRSWNLREFSNLKSKVVDDHTFGGGAGMVLSPEPILKAIESAKKRQNDANAKKNLVIYMSPEGQNITNKTLKFLSEYDGLIVLSGRYEGIDDRVSEFEIDIELSVGDFIVSGGELPTMLLLDGLIRRIPGAVTDANSVYNDSFEDGLLDYPHFTKPRNLNGKHVPEVLLSGNHKEIEKWRLRQSLKRTFLKRPDLIYNLKMNEKQKKILDL